MKRFYLILTLSLVVIFSFVGSDAMAVGIGLYTSYSTGSADWTAEDDSGTLDFEDDTHHVGVGFILDTNLAKDSLFNYRLKLGYDKLVSEEYRSGNKDFEFDGFIWDNTFGFGVLRNEMLRLWLGPQLGFSGYSGENPYEEGDAHLFGVNLGAVLGLNFNPGNVITIALETGYKYTKYWGIQEMEYYDDFDLEVDEGVPFINFAIIFRFGDRY